MESKRLIYKDEFGKTHTTNERINGKFIGDKAVREKLFEYEQAESEGKLIHLPCKIGADVWLVMRLNPDGLFGCYNGKPLATIIQDNIQMICITSR